MFSYNGINFPYTLSTKFSQDVIYDENPGGGRGGAADGTDWYCTRFDIAIQAIFSIDYIEQIFPAFAAATQDNAAAIINAIRQRLLTPRCAMSYVFGGVNVIPQNDYQTGLVDAQNGPQPKTCQISELYTGTWLVQYHIVAHYWESNVSTVDVNGNIVTVNRAGNPVLSNRWTETVTMDALGMSTRERDGRYIIRSDNVNGYIADNLRSSMAVVSIPVGFLRTTSRYTQSPDGLAIHYRFVDEEQFKQPPEGAFKAKGRYHETATRLGARKIGRVDLTLWGSKGDPSNLNRLSVPQHVLISRALTIAAGYLSERAKQNQATGYTGFIILDSVEVDFDWFEENRVTVSIQAQSTAVSGVSANPIGQMQGITTDIPGAPANSNYVPPYTTRESAGLLLQAAKYYDPTLRNLKMGPAFIADGADNNVIPIGGDLANLSEGKQPGTAGRDGEVGK